MPPQAIAVSNRSTNSSPQSLLLNESSSSGETGVSGQGERTVIETVAAVQQRKDLTAEEIVSIEGPDTWDNLSENMSKCSIPNKRSDESGRTETKNGVRSRKDRDGNKEDEASPASKRLKFNK